MNNENYNNLILSINKLSKVFPGGIIALENVNLDLYAGEVVSILGENGSGKSTLVKILYGVYTPDSGEIKLRINNTMLKVHFSTPLDAMRHGIVLVNQVPQLIDRLSIAENLAITLSTLKIKSCVFSNIEYVSKMLRETAELLGVKIDPGEKVYNLTYTQKQFIELIRAIMVDAKIIMLDEALTYLPPIEKKKWYDLLKTLKNSGKTIVLITHKIHEALELSDRIVVLRKGRIVGVVNGNEATADRVRQLMFGESFNGNELIKQNNSNVNQHLEHEIVIENLYVSDDHGREILRDVNLNVKKGEIAGVVGVSGSGQRELIESIVGLRKPVRGKIKVAEVDVIHQGIKALRRSGVGFITDHPLKYCISSDNSIVENIALSCCPSGLILNWDLIEKKTREIIEEYNIQAESVNSPVKTLSGGNLMKVIIGRELERAKRVFIAYNPTRALDELSTVRVLNKLKSKARDEKVSVLIASDDADEVLSICDTLYVLSSGRLIGPFNPRNTPRERIEELMVT
ncbi:MAG: ATP-binding cassette domain-containing protein [Desulfurococcaceae archaeon]